VSSELYKAASEKAKAGKAASGGPPPESGSGRASDTKDEGPIIDAEVVDEKKQ
jgi:hypothetical protein